MDGCIDGYLELSVLLAYVVHISNWEIFRWRWMQYHHILVAIIGHR